MRKILEYDRNDTYEKKQQMDTNFSEREKKMVLEKIERYSLSSFYDKILKHIYVPMKEYRELLSLIKTKEHARGCALSSEELSISPFDYFIDIIVHSIIRDYVERN